MAKKPSFFNQNYDKLVELCKREGYEIEEIDAGSQYRVYAATHVIDFWPSRMIYHRIKGENIKSVEPYHRDLDWRFNKEQVSKLLATGEL